MPANTNLILEAGNIGARQQDRLRSMAPKSDPMEIYKLMMEVDKNKASIASSKASAKTSAQRGEKITLETLQLKKEASLAHMQGAGESPETLERAKAAWLRDDVTKDIPIPPELEAWTPETPAIVNQMMMQTVDVAKQQELRLRQEENVSKDKNRTLTRQDKVSQFETSEANKEARSLRAYNKPNAPPAPSEFERTMAAAGEEKGSPGYIKAARIKGGLEEKPGSDKPLPPLAPSFPGKNETDYVETKLEGVGQEENLAVKIATQAKVRARQEGISLDAAYDAEIAELPEVQQEPGLFEQAKAWFSKQSAQGQGVMQELSQSAKPTTAYPSKEAVRAAVKSGQLPVKEAAEILKSQFGMTD